MYSRTRFHVTNRNKKFSWNFRTRKRQKIRRKLNYRRQHNMSFNYICLWFCFSTFSIRLAEIEKLNEKKKSANFVIRCVGNSSFWKNFHFKSHRCAKKLEFCWLECCWWQTSLFAGCTKIRVGGTPRNVFFP